MIPRGKCQACCGGGRVIGGGSTTGDPRGAFAAGENKVGWCLRCRGSGVECDEDYALRVRSLRQREAT